MPFLRILLVLLAVLAAVVAGLAFLRPDFDPEPAPPPRVEAAPPRPAAAPPTFPRERTVMTPADASSPAEITAQEAAEAQARLEKEQQDEMMGAP